MQLMPAVLQQILAGSVPAGVKVSAGTGHRPDKLGGYDDPIYWRALNLALWHLKEHPCHVVISGMANGWDQAIAKAAMLHRIPFIAAVPFKGQEGTWPKSRRHHYHNLLECADHVEIIDPDVRDFTEMRKAFDKRNRWMVDRCTHLVTLWNGTPGGTANCIRYAQRVNRKTYDLWPYWEKGVWP